MANLAGLARGYQHPAVLRQLRRGVYSRAALACYFYWGLSGLLSYGRAGKFDQH